MDFISTRQVGARIRTGRLPDYSKGGKTRCACHPDVDTGYDTEALRFWQKGMTIWCKRCNKLAPALARFEALGVTIDTRL